jgi:CheY-like chemotaxis protein
MLIAEDNPDDIFLLKRAFAKAGLPITPRFFQNGQEALDYLEGKSPFHDRSVYPLPRLLLLDIKMPGKSGLEVLRDIRNTEPLKRLVAVMFSSSAEVRDVDRAYDLGANAYVVKPGDCDDLVPILRRLHDFWFLTNQPSSDVYPDLPAK